MTTLVTGATGHIGVNLLRALMREGRKVRAFVRSDVHWLDGLDVEIVRGDIRDAEAVRKAVRGAEVVYHLAAHISIIRGEAHVVRECNIQGPRNVVGACLDAGVRRLVHFSSIHALSVLPRGATVDETRALNSDLDPVPHYDRSKSMGEREVRAGIERGLDVVTVNPTGVIGPYDYRPSAMGSVLLDLYHRRLPSLVDGGYNFVDVRDVVAGAMAAEARGRKGERYLLSGHWVSTPQIGAIVEEVTGKRAPRFVCPMWLARTAAPFAELYAKAAGRPPLFTSAALHALRNHREISHKKATDELGYAPRPTRETIADTFEWFRDAKVI
jgi:dihydroflavonol-4-reductase